MNVGSLRDFERFLRARSPVGQLLNKADLARDVGIAPSTSNQWLSVLEASGQVVLLEPWFSNRTKSLVKSPKLYLADSGLLCALLNIRSPTSSPVRPAAGPSGRRSCSRNCDTASAGRAGPAVSSSGATGHAKWTSWLSARAEWNCSRRNGTSAATPPTGQSRLRPQGRRRGESLGRLHCLPHAEPVSAPGHRYSSRSAMTGSTRVARSAGM